MNRLLNTWRPILLGLVLLSVLVGVAGAVPTNQPSALSTRRQLMISAADFYPINDDIDYNNDGTDVRPMSGSGYFIAPVDFPYPLWVTIDKFELFAYDNNSAQEIRVWLNLSKPASFSEENFGYVATGMPYASDTNGTWQDTTISPNVKNPADDLYVYVWFGDSANLRLYGVRIFYYMGR